MRHITLLLSLLLLSFLTSGCSRTIYKNYEYEGQELSHVANTPLRIAVVPFTDKRESYDKGSFKLAYIPLVPTSARKVQRRQTEADQTKLAYYYPGLIAHSLKTDIEKNNVAAEVHYAPQVLEHYDIIIDGDLEKLELSARNNTYGLSIAGRLLAMLFLPPTWVSSDVQANYRVSLPDGEVLFENRYEGSWASPGSTGDEEKFLNDVHTYSGMQNIHAIIYSFQEMNKSFLEATKESMNNLAGVIDETFRAQSFYASIDPDMDILLERLEQQGNGKSTRQYRARQNWLERYRTHEWQQVQKEEWVKRDLLQSRFTAIAQLRNQKRNVLHAEKAASRARTKAFMGQFASVLAASGQAMATRRNAGISQSETRSAFLRDTATGTSAIRSANIPAVPRARLLADLNASSTGALSAVDASSISKIRGATIGEMRAQFLRLYRRKFPRIR